MKHKVLLNYRLIIHSLGALLFVETIAMTIPTLTAFITNDGCQYIWLLSTVFSLVLATFGYKAFNKDNGEWGKREGYLVVAIVWVLFSLISTIPMYYSGVLDNVTDAFFESMSGFTTTGASILKDVDNSPKSILMWRAVMQWMGGMGIIVLSLSFGFGGMQLYIAEVSGPTKEKMSPRVMQTAQMLWGYYLMLTILAIILLLIGGMEPFDALCNAMCTVSTGGFCTKSASIAYWGNAPFLQYTIIFFMVFCSINFTMTYFAVTGKPKKAFRNEEVRNFLLVCFGTIFLAFLFNLKTQPGWTTEETFRKSAFMISAAMSGSGHSIDDIMTWTRPIWCLFLLVSMLGGCSGSATGGLKIIRVSVLVKNSFEEFKRLLHPNAMIPLKFNRHPISADTTNNVMAFVSLYICCLIVSTILMSSFDMTTTDALGMTVSGLCNTGLGFGSYSTGNFYMLPDAAKWLYSALMLIGRLEVFTILLLFTPVFWRR